MNKSNCDYPFLDTTALADCLWHMNVILNPIFLYSRKNDMVLCCPM